MIRRMPEQSLNRMSDAKLTYLGQDKTTQPLVTEPLWRKFWNQTSKSFLIVVCIPMLLATLYYYLVASPIYVSEAKFIVRQTERQTPSSIGLVLQNVGISSSTTDSYVVHEYIKSHAAVQDITKRLDLAKALSPAGSDFLTRYPRPWERSSTDGLHEGFNRFVSVGHDSGTGMSTLKVRAFNPRDAQLIANELLKGGEQVVNRLNTRANQGAIDEAEKNLAEAEAKLAQAQTVLSNFRNQERIIDPARSAGEGSEMVGELMATIAEMKAERAQIAQQAPQSPLLATLDSRIAAYQQQVEAERSKLAGDMTSLAPKMAIYESLSLDREYASRALTSARAALDSARTDGRRQKLYLEEVVPPNLPSDPSLPNRERALLTILATLLLTYGVGWLIVAGIREHQLG